LLGLPYHIRRHIYAACGFPTGVMLQFSNNTENLILLLLSGRLLRLPKGLMRSCRSVYQEWSSMLYGENLLAIGNGPYEERSLAILDKFTDTTTRNMRHVSVRLKSWGAVSSCRNHQSQVLAEKGRDQIPHRFDYYYLPPWERFCVRLSKHCQAASL
jgi:hypothetical protein